MLLRIQISKLRPGHEDRLRRVVEALPTASVAPTEGGAEPCDLVLVHLDELGAAPRTAVARLRADHGAEVVVLQAREAGEERAELLAAGAYAVLPEGLSERSLARTLGTLVARRRERLLAELAARQGGRVGPEVEPASDVMRRLLADADRAAGADASLLLLGETGVGKEWLARRVHARSRRAGGPFVALNCAAVPEALWESELFGHERGAFTGAERARRGHFELAHGGTLFLDEVGDMPPALQAKLLRALETRLVQRLGGERPTAVDVRIVAASNRDLEVARSAGEFRDDLYYRLAVVVLTLPPLRERGADVGRLADAWCAHFSRRFGRPAAVLSPAARAALAAYRWPGNVRELANVVERAVLLADGDEVTLADLPVAIATAAGEGEPAVDGRALLPWRGEEWFARPLPEVTRAVVAEVERAYLHRQLAATGGQVGETARRAGIHPRSLYNKMRTHGLDKEEFKRGRSC